MSESPQVRAARRRYVTVCVLFWLPPGLGLAPMIPLCTDRGMSLAAVAGFFAAHSLTAAALELPTGGLSDVLGRRAVLAAGGALSTVALIMVGLGTTAWVLTLGMVLKGAGRALASGPAEAWYVDTVHAHAGPGAELRTGLARGSTATSGALAAGILLGGALPWLLGVVPGLGAGLREATSGAVPPLAVPVLLGAVVEAVFVGYVLAALREPPRPRTGRRSVLRGIPATVAGGLRLGTRDALVRRVLLSAAATGSALAALELLTPARAVALTGTSESGAVLYAALACAGFVCAGAGSHLGSFAARAAGSGERAVLAGLGAGAAGLLLLGVTAQAAQPYVMVLAGAGFCLVYLGLGVAGPSENELLHRRVPSGGRATALSVQSLALQLAGALTGLVLGGLRSGPVPWLAAAAVLLSGALLWLRRPAADAEPELTGPGVTGRVPEVR
ncbi:MFS transporter [Streptomyces sp. NPDC052682]|uniref:MFS transporter n=1 Tax=Streptomyces sp. NPDC052682 TaxID=3154954 RepID=UPI00341808A9